MFSVLVFQKLKKMFEPKSLYECNLTKLLSLKFFIDVGSSYVIIDESETSRVASSYFTCSKGAGTTVHTVTSAECPSMNE